MGKELAAAAEQIFSEIAGATIEHKGGLLKCTITPAQYDEYLKGDSMGARTARALRELDKAQTACWNGTKILKKSYIVGCGGGTGEFGIWRSLHENDDPFGKCLNCGHVNTKRQTTILTKRHDRLLRHSRRRWRRMIKEDNDSNALE